MNAYDDETNTVNELAQAMGLPCQVRFSSELLELLKPNPFLAGLGIQYSDRINAILSILKGSFTPGSSNNGIVIPIPLVRGPYIREEMISIKTELDDSGKQLLLTAVLETD